MPTSSQSADLDVSIEQGAINAAEFVGAFKDYPPRQKPQSFNLDQIMQQLQHPTESD